MKAEDEQFDAWIKFIFDRPEMTEPFDRWFHIFTTAESFKLDDEAEAWENPQERFMDYMTRTMRESGEILPRFTKLQALTGLSFIFDCDYFRHLLVSPIYDKHVLLPGERQRDLIKNVLLPWERRRDLIRSIYHLYADYLAKVHPFDYYCVFENWWDNFPLPKPFYGQPGWGVKALPPESLAYYDEVLSLMERVVELKVNWCDFSIKCYVRKWEDGTGRAEKLATELERRLDERLKLDKERRKNKHT